MRRGECLLNSKPHLAGRTCRRLSSNPSKTAQGGINGQGVRWIVIGFYTFVDSRQVAGVKTTRKVGNVEADHTPQGRLVTPSPPTHPWMDGQRSARTSSPCRAGSYSARVASKQARVPSELVSLSPQASPQTTYSRKHSLTPHYLPSLPPSLPCCESSLVRSVHSTSTVVPALLWESPGLLSGLTLRLKPQTRGRQRRSGCRAGGPWSKQTDR